MKVYFVGLLTSFLVSTHAFGTTLSADAGIAGSALQSCKSDLRYLNQVVGWQVTWPRQWQAVVSSGPDNLDASMSTFTEAPSALDSAVETLRLGMANKQTAPIAVVTRVKQQVEELLSELSTENTKYLFKNVQLQSAGQWNALIKDKIVPAVAAFNTFLGEEYLPAANRHAGLSHLQGGTTCFYDAVTWWTTLNLSVEEIEGIGRRFLQESHAQLLATGNEGETVAGMLASLRAEARTNDTNAETLINVSEKALVRAQEGHLSVFSHPASDNLVVNEMPLYMQASAPAGYYGQAQGTAPARYIINPSRPNERHLMAEVIAFHEGVPGHHLWASYPRETPSSGYNSGILEGWAIYSEYLADEMGLYSTTYDRQGMMAKHLWAASRLIVEPGLHLRGWSREEAIQFMLENTVMSRTEIEIEVDRYIAMPGQSLSYILGANVILSERQRAREILGNAFSLAAFHHEILAPGVRPLPQMREDIRKWVESVRDSAS